MSQSDERPRDVIELGILHELESATRRMRGLQVQYFQTRNRKTLIDCKTAERTVDARLRDLQTLTALRLEDEAIGGT